MTSGGKKNSGLQELERILRKALIRLFGTRSRKARATVRIAYLPDAEMRIAARRFLGERKKYIDVLAFPEAEEFPHPEAKKGMILGDIYLRTGLKKKALELRVFFMFHGLLHLLGYTHEGTRDTIEMESRERALFAKLLPKTTHPWPRSISQTSHIAHRIRTKKRI